MRREPDLSQAFVELADTLVSDFDVIDFLHSLAQRCVDLLDVDAAGLMLADHTGDLHMIAASSQQVRLLELFELQNQEGPCLDAFRWGEPVHERDLDATDRWPRFGPEAQSLGFRAVQAFPMRLREEVIGALNLFRVEPGLLSDAEQAMGRAMADVATIGLLQERAIREATVLAEQLQVALNSRILIEQAKGVLAERASLDMNEAFERLRAYARNHNLRLAVVARSLIDSKISTDQLISGRERS